MYYLDNVHRYLKSDSITVTSDNVIQILYLSKKYLVENLSNICCQLLSKKLNSGTVLQIIQLAIMYDEERLLQQCVLVVWKHTRRSLRSKQLLTLSDTMLACFLNVLETSGMREAERLEIKAKWDSHQMKIVSRLEKGKRHKNPRRKGISALCFVH